MSKKNLLIAVVVIVIVGAGGYAIFHKSNKPTATNTNPATPSSVPAVNNSVLTTKTDSQLGQYLVDPSGQALYTYNADSSGVSNCTGSCLANWPAYQAKGSVTGLPAGISTITRVDNGQVQYTYNGMPLYYFTSDTQGKVTGNGVENFTVAKPAPSSPSTTTSPSSSSTPSYNSSDSPY
jgi:predicted lipoprotein with Yx(FWY)xxD motif